MGHSEFDPASRKRRPWNAGKMVGAKRALKPQQVWAIRFWLDRERRLRDRALFDLAIDSKLRGCDLVDEWVTARGLRHALAPADQSVDHLQNHRQLAGSAAPPGP
jgi:hypothetical protein